LDISFRVALPPAEPGLVEATLARVATPGTSDYRKYLSAEEINALAAPDAASAARAVSWLEAGGARVVETNAAGDWLSVRASVSQVERLFSTTLNRFANSRDGSRTRIATAGPYSIPDEVSSVINIVAGLNSFGGQLGVATFDGKAAAVGGVPATVTPDTIYDVYGVDPSG
jgi:tripeptidyl-peptidase-1